jgi:DNA invertase Pin-like site-specific DNA recombinase
MIATQQPRRFVPYLRVSTAKQGRSGLGLEAQQAAIASFVQAGDMLLAPPFVEVESGRKANRPQLDAAIARCRQVGATLLVAKLDRLSRDAHFLLGLKKAGVEFIAADMPHANQMTVGIMALVAEEEAKAASRRTKEALAAAKARGVKLGGFRAGARPPSAEEVKRGAAVSAERRQVLADQAAHRVVGRIEELRAQHWSFEMIAGALNKEGVATPRGGSWSGTTVRRALLRAGGES